MLNSLIIEKISVSNEYNDNLQRQNRILHTIHLIGTVKTEESNESQNNELDNENFSTKTASMSVLRLITKNQILGLEADSLEVRGNWGDSLPTNENDLDKIFFKVKNNPRDNQLDFVYYLVPWQKCSIRFSFLCQESIDINTINKMNVQEWIW